MKPLLFEIPATSFLPSLPFKEVLRSLFFPSADCMVMVQREVALTLFSQSEAETESARAHEAENASQS